MAVLMNSTTRPVALKAGRDYVAARLRLLGNANDVTKWAAQPRQGKTLDPEVATWIARRLPGECVVQAVVLARLLARGGRSPKVKLGVRRGESGQVEAHAWVELDGGRFLDADDFEPLTKRP